jgi:hypothetical protein
MSSVTGQNAEAEFWPQTLLDDQGCFPQAFSIGVVLFWVEKTHRSHAVRASADYVAQGRLGMHLEVPAPVGSPVWIVLASGSGLRGIVQSCEAVPEGYQVEVRLMAR